MGMETKLSSVRFLLSSFITIFILAVSAGLADAQDCEFTICKSAEDSGDTEFGFFGSDFEGFFDFGLLGSGEGSCNSATYPPQTMAEVFEAFEPGWRLVEIDCQGASGVGTEFLFDDNDNIVGVSLLCDSGNEPGFATCTFINVPDVTVTTTIPTISEWGLIAMSGILGIIGLLAIRKRKVEA